MRCRCLAGVGSHIPEVQSLLSKVHSSQHRRSCNMLFSPPPHVPCQRQEKLVDLLAETHDVFYIVVSPIDLGWPVRRRRVFCCGLSRATMAWLGPEQDDILQHFLGFFARTLQTDGDVFLVASDDRVFDEHCLLAGQRGLSLSSAAREGNVLVSPEHVYAPGQVVRLQEYGRMRDEVAPSGAFFADLNQNCGAGASAPGPVIPSMLTSCTLHSFSKRRVVLTEELLQAHGFNMYAEEMTPGTGPTWPPCRIREHLLQLNRAQRQKLLGNGWHLPVFASWFHYILAHTVKLDRQVTVHPERSLWRKGSSSVFSWGRASSSLSLGSCEDECTELQEGQLGG